MMMLAAPQGKVQGSAAPVAPRRIATSQTGLATLAQAKARRGVPQALQTQADTSARLKSLANLKNAAIQRASDAHFGNKVFGNAASDLVFNIGGSLASTFFPVGDEARYGPLTGRGFGTFMEAKLTPGNHSEGSRTSSKDSNSTFKSLKLRRQDDGRQMYVQGHLLNYWLGGSGTDWHNLVPITENTNRTHEGVVEKHVKSAAVTPHHSTIYRVRPVYGTWPWNWPTSAVRMATNPLIAAVTGSAFFKLHEAEQHIPSALQCDWWITDPAGRTTAHSARIIQDYGTSRLMVQYGNQAVDMTRTAFAWNLIEEGLGFALRSVLTANVALLEPAARAAALVMTGEQAITLLRRLIHFRGGIDNAVNTVFDSRWTTFGTAIQVLVEYFGYGAISAALINLFGKTAKGAQKSSVAINREQYEMLRDQRADERNPPPRARKARGYYTE